VSDQQPDATTQDVETDVTPDTTTQDAVDVDQQATTPPWTADDFDPERAWKRIENQRADLERVRQENEALQTRAAQADRLREDPDALREFLGELGYQFTDDDEPDDNTEEDEGVSDDLDPNLRELLEWKQRKEAEEEHEKLVATVSAVNEQLDSLAEPDEIALDEEDRKYLLWAAATSSDGLTRDSVKAVYERHAERQKQLRKTLLGQVVDSKPASPVSPGGAEATEVPDLSDEATRHAWMIERVAQGRS
jgi:hypothetical protein